MRISCQSQRDRGQSRVEERWRSGGVGAYLKSSICTRNRTMSKCPFSTCSSVNQFLGCSSPMHSTGLFCRQQRESMRGARRGARAHGHTGRVERSSVCLRKDSTAAFNMWLKMLCCQSPSFLSENDFKAYECLQLVCLLRSIIPDSCLSPIFWWTFWDVSSCWGFFGKMMTFSMIKDSLCVGPGKQLPRAVSTSEVSFTHLAKENGNQI